MLPPMPLESAARHAQSHAARRPARLGPVLLVAVGSLLVGAGALLWFQHGSVVIVRDTALAVLAWCL